ncbi:RICIN domain-containing protein [Streptomyces sp. NPDC004658]|uniref:RICIN domain-containing protein n=1 Tax=Streptomyces sp. NPDC004658 TaxID=3154672 RepID=UPI0033AFF897
MNKLARVSIVASAMSAALSVFVGIAPSASAASGPRLMNDNNYCLGSQGGANRTNALQWYCNSNPDQSWHFSKMGSDSHGTYYRVTNDNGQCLGINGVSQASGATATVWDCNGNKDQLWYWQKGSSAGWYQMINRNSQMCLGTKGSAVGAKAIQWPCNGNPDQRWGQLDH